MVKNLKKSLSLCKYTQGSSFEYFFENHKQNQLDQFFSFLSQNWNWNHLNGSQHVLGYPKTLITPEFHDIYSMIVSIKEENNKSVMPNVRASLEHVQRLESEATSTCGERASDSWSPMQGPWLKGNGRLGMSGSLPLFYCPFVTFPFFFGFNWVFVFFGFGFKKVCVLWSKFMVLFYLMSQNY